MTVRVDAGSYRDPRGHVVLAGDRVLRTVRTPGLEDYQFVRATGVLDTLIADGRVIGEREVDAAPLGELAEGARRVLEHPRLPFVSWPYEWCFEQLQAAALLHLDLHQVLLGQGCTLSDASAYNVQFRGAHPVFIDNLSFRRYRDGEIWVGHRQFCEQFLNPLLLHALAGIAHQGWYRGAPEGIGAGALRRVLPFAAKLRWNTFMHVVAQSALQRASTTTGNAAVPRKINLPLAAQQRMLAGLRRWVAKLAPAGRKSSTWSDYTRTRNYTDAEVDTKRAFVERFAATTRPAVLWDIGCNTGEFSALALGAGAGYAVGFDTDERAVALAFARAREERLALLPLVMDLANPSPDQGWAQAERGGLARRGPADAVLALAVVHHLAITRNVPLAQVVQRLVDCAPAGVMEFVPKADAMVQTLLRLREDIFEDYDEAHFRACLTARARIVQREQVSASGRALFWYERD